MELQAIREKLQSLQEQPTTAETLSLPWSMPAETNNLSTSAESPETRLVQGHSGYSDVEITKTIASQPAAERKVVEHKTVEHKSAQQLAIEALKQRSHGSELASARIDNLIAQELYRLEVQANLINEQSKRQAEDIQALKRSAQQASVGLRRQGIQDHPQLAVITGFLEQYSSAAVPHIDRNQQGYFTLSYDTVDFQQAQQDADDTAHALRNRGQKMSHVDNMTILPETKLHNESLQNILFSQQISSESPRRKDLRKTKKTGQKSYNSYSQTERPRKNRLQKSLGNTIDKVLYLFGQNKERVRKPAGVSTALSNDFVEGLDFSSFEAQCDREGFMSSEAVASGTSTDLFSSSAGHRPRESQFSWLDGMIWFSGAAITRLFIQSFAANYPITQTLFVSVLACTIIFALYRVVIVRSEDYSLVYRLCIAMFGLLLAGLST